MQCGFLKNPMSVCGAHQAGRRKQTGFTRGEVCIASCEYAHISDVSLRDYPRLILDFRFGILDSGNKRVIWIFDFGFWIEARRKDYFARGRKDAPSSEY
jgi:hypothetical protein